MAEKNLESGQLAGSEETTNPPVSQNVGDERTSSFDADQLLERLVPVLEPLIEKKVQSTKDRRFLEQEQFRSEYQPILERFKDLVDPQKLQEIQKDLEFEDLKRIVYGQKQTGENENSGKVQQAPAIDAAQAIREAGLDTNDPKVILMEESLRKKNASEAEVNAAIVSHLKAQKQAPSPSAAQQLAEPGKPEAPKNLEGLTTEYIEKVKAARGKPNVIKQLREQAIKDGVRVWEIDFSNV